jgi:thiol-disulfide isomerase/thioredoxin
VKENWLLRNLLLVIVILITSYGTRAQKIEVIDTPQLLAIINEKDPQTKIINFWATWCKPCVQELPYLEEINSSGKAKVILVSLDFLEDLDTRVNRFISNYEMTSQLYLMKNVDYNSWIDKVDSSWTGAIPATLVLNTLAGKRKFIERQLNDKDIESIINEINYQP